MPNSDQSSLSGKHVVFIHGWALNSGVWADYIANLHEQYPGISTQCIDLPGYGHSLNVECDGSLESMAGFCLEQVDRPAIWVGWSLGGMVAMQAAILQAALDKPFNTIQAMQLICTSPKFVEGDGWPEGVDIDSFRLFSKQLASDYERTLTLFLLMQAGSKRDARELAKTAHQAICQLPNPSAETLNVGIECLSESDLRADVEALSIPAQVVSGLRDRVAKPVGSARLASMLRATLIELDAGHAPFMTKTNEVMLALAGLASGVNRPTI